MTTTEEQLRRQAEIDTAALNRLKTEVARLNDENERLSFDYERLAGRKLTDEVDAEKALADDLADVLSRMVVGWERIIGHDLAQHPDVQRVMARYREARGR
jgi:predicted nuclease with TOPRIM domain